MTPEGKVKARFAKLAKQYGILYINLIQTGSKGDPDKLILPKGGRPIFAEFKAEGGKLSPSQEKKIAMYAELGYDMRVIEGAEAAEALAEEVQRINEMEWV